MAADYSITEHLPVSNHVYKFLVKRCGSDVFVAHRNTFIGNVILSSLGKSTDVRIGSSVNFTKIFNVVIKDHYYLKNGVHLSFKNAKVFNNMIDLLFREEMFAQIIILHEANNTNFVELIKNYLKAYDITEDDLKLDTIYRDFKRKKEKLQQKLID